MAEWYLLDRDSRTNPYDPLQFIMDQYYQENEPAPPFVPPGMPPPPPPVPQPNFANQSSSQFPNYYNNPSTSNSYQFFHPPAAPLPKLDNPREIRNKAEKQRRDKLNQSIAELAAMVPPVVASSRKIDKTGVLRLTAHYLRAHQYVFGESCHRAEPQFSSSSANALMSMINGFLLTVTYRGLIVVISQNVQKYLGYTELDLLGQSIFNIIHDEDKKLMRDMIMPPPHLLGPNGELLVPEDADGKRKLARTLIAIRKKFVVRFKKLGQRSEPPQYLSCHIDGNLRKSDRACRGYNRCCQMVRRARARGDNPCNSGNDVVFVAVVRIAKETFMTESRLEAYRMEYRTRHSVDGQIIQSEQRISLVTGYMTHEVNGINAMNFMHRDDVRWVVIALREMYDQHRLVGESCYRLLTKNGEFIYLRTRGRLEVDPNTREVTSFVCTNTLVDEDEGRDLVKIMKKKFMLMVNNNEEPIHEEETKDTNDQVVSVENPKQLEKVILHLVTNLPSPETADIRGDSPDRGPPPSERLAIIPPEKETIVSAIEKIYSVITTLPKDMENEEDILKDEMSTPSTEPHSILMSFLEAPVTSSPPVLSITPLSSYIQNNTNSLVELPNFSSLHPIQYPEPNKPTELDINVYNPTTTPKDMTLSMAQLPSSSYLGKAIALGNMIDPITMTNEVQSKNDAKYQLGAASSAGNDNIDSLLEIKKSLPTGVKRPREYIELTTADAKKKNTDIINAIEIFEEPSMLDDVPLLESLFDETLFNTSFPQIDITPNSLEQNIDPIFPDLLLSQEVQDILQDIENSPVDKQDK